MYQIGKRHAIFSNMSKIAKLINKSKWKLLTVNEKLFKATKREKMYKLQETIHKLVN